MDRDILTPHNGLDWLALLLITALGTAAPAWLLPFAAQHPFVMPPGMYDQFTPIKKPFTGLMNLTPVAVGITVVAACALLYCLWMSWSLNHPVIRSGPWVRRDDR